MEAGLSLSGWLFEPELWVILGIILIIVDIVIGFALLLLPVGVAALLLGARSMAMHVNCLARSPCSPPGAWSSSGLRCCRSHTLRVPEAQGSGRRRWRHQRALTQRQAGKPDTIRHSCRTWTLANARALSPARRASLSIPAVTPYQLRRARGLTTKPVEFCCNRDQQSGTGARTEAGDRACEGRLGHPRCEACIDRQHDPSIPSSRPSAVGLAQTPAIVTKGEVRMSQTTRIVKLCYAWLVAWTSTNE